MSTPHITIRMNAPCVECGQMGATPSGLCLGCVAKGLSMPTDHEQLSLTTEWVELTDDEKIERGFRLANLIRELKLMEDEHAERKKDMREEKVALQQTIATAATVVRTGKEERPIGREGQ